MELTQLETETALISVFMHLSVQLNLAEHPVTKEYTPLDEIGYSKDWNILLPVAQQIDEIISKNDLDEWVSELYIAMSTININIVYRLVVDFIKWWAKNKRWAKNKI